MKNSNDIIGNRTRDLRACCATAYPWRLYYDVETDFLCLLHEIPAAEHEQNPLEAQFTL